MNNYTELASFATVRQLEYLEAVEKHGSVRKASKALGVAKNSIDGAMKALKKKAALALITEHASVEKVAEGFSIKGTTTLIKDGKQALQWVKTDRNAQEQADMMRVALEAMCSEIPKAAPIKPPSSVLRDDLCNLYTFTDYHLGMLAWGKEAGADWDLKIAEDLLWDCFRRMVDASPKAAKCVINIQGDFLHSDGLIPVTPAHKHVLDTDGRFGKIIDVAIRVIRRLIAYALATHQEVHLVIVEGNHDECSSLWLRKMFGVMLEDESRITVNDSELPYYVYQHGNTMLSFHHGHKASNEQMPMIMAAQFPKIWGSTTHRYCHTGHRHHLDEKEYAGMTVTQHPTVSARDSHSARGGYISERAAIAITYHAKSGQYGRVYVTPEMIGN